MVGEVRPGENDYLSRDDSEEAQIRFICSDYNASAGKSNWPCFDGGTAHFTTVIPINYRSDVRVNCVPYFVDSDVPNVDKQELIEHSKNL
jgi:hypothetical protein